MGWLIGGVFVALALGCLMYLYIAFRAMKGMRVYRQWARHEGRFDRILFPGRHRK